jgi:hypothetical protein
MTQTEKEAAVVAKAMTDNVWLERCLILLFDRQTIGEQISKNTHNENSRGFNKPDGMALGYMCEWIRDKAEAPLGKRMNDKMRIKARAKLPKYRRQLVEIVEEIKAGTTKMPM